MAMTKAKGVISLDVKLGESKIAAVVSLARTLGTILFARVARVIEEAAADTGLGPVKKRSAKSWELAGKRLLSRRRREEFYKFITADLRGYSVVFSGVDGDGERYEPGVMSVLEFRREYRALTARESRLAIERSKLLGDRRALLRKKYR